MQSPEASGTSTLRRASSPAHVAFFSPPSLLSPAPARQRCVLTLPPLPTPIHPSRLPPPSPLHPRPGRLGSTLRRRLSTTKHPTREFDATDGSIGPPSCARALEQPAPPKRLAPVCRPLRVARPPTLCSLGIQQTPSTLPSRLLTILAGNSGLIGRLPATPPQS